MTQHEEKVINSLPGGTSPIVDRKPQTLDALCTVDSHGTDPMDPWRATFMVMVGAMKLYTPSGMMTYFACNILST